MTLDDIYKSLSDEEGLELSIIEDPVRWAEATLRNPRNPNEALCFRPYQKDMISHQAVFKVTDKKNKAILNRAKIYRCGRRTGKTTSLAVEAIYHAFTRSNFRVLVIAPFESQVRGIFDEIHKLIYGSFIKPERDVKKPFIMEFGNGSTILGFTAGATSSVKGSNIRGRGADLLIIDECDHGVDSVISEVIMPIFVNNKECRLIMSSTPSGRHGVFWEMCQDPGLYGAVEFHVPSTMLPGWDKQQEALAKKSCKTRTRYLHEYLAEFGEREEGVFLHKHIMKCLSSYITDEDRNNGVNPYENVVYNPRMQYFMGVDWNEIYGVTLCIVEKHPKKDKVKLWKKIRIEKTEFTQPEAVNEIIRWSEKINFSAIYVDQGFGYAQDQWLRKHGKEHKDSNLNEVVKAIDFGGKITIRDVVTNKKIKKQTKPFLVDNAVYYVENNLLEMPVYEDEKSRLVGAMRGYKVKGFSKKSNDPKYECDEEDHELDALFLALLAVNMETTEVSKTSDHQTPVSVTSPFIPKDTHRDIERETSQNNRILEEVIRSALPNYDYRYNKSMESRTTGLTRSRRPATFKNRRRMPKRTNI